MELSNHDGRYNKLPAELAPGCLLGVRSGYITTDGAQYGPLSVFVLQRLNRLPERPGAVAAAGAGWLLLAGALAGGLYLSLERQRLPACVKDILAFLLWRAGIRLDSSLCSAVAANTFVDFTIEPGEGGDEVLMRLLSYLPDRLYMQGLCARLVDILQPVVADWEYHGAGEPGCDYQLVQAGYRGELYAANQVAGSGCNSSSIVEVNNESESSIAGRVFNSSPIAAPGARSEGPGSCSLMQASYWHKILPVNQVRVEGLDGNGNPVAGSAFDFPSITESGLRLQVVSGFRLDGERRRWNWPRTSCKATLPMPVAGA